MPDHFLLGQVRIRVVERSTGKPVSGVILRIANSHEAALGQR